MPTSIVEWSEGLSIKVSIIIRSLATELRAGWSGIDAGGDEIFRPSRPALGPTQPTAKWVPDLSQGVKCGRGVLLTTHPLLVPRSPKSRAITLPTLWATSGL